MGRHSTGNFLMQCWPRQIDPDKIVDYFSVQSCSWAVGINIAQVILLCNVGAGRSKQHCIGYFPAKTCLHALDQHWHCTSNFLVQCCLRCRTILTRQYSYAMLSQHGQYNIVGYFPHKRGLFAVDQHFAHTGDFLVQCWPRKIRTILQIIFFCKVVCGLCNDRCRWVK